MIRPLLRFTRERRRLMRGRGLSGARTRSNGTSGIRSACACATNAVCARAVQPGRFPKCCVTARLLRAGDGVPTGLLDAGAGRRAEHRAARGGQAAGVSLAAEWSSCASRRHAAGSLRVRSRRGVRSPAESSDAVGGRRAACGRSGRRRIEGRRVQHGQAGLPAAAPGTARAGDLDSLRWQIPARGTAAREVGEVLVSADDVAADAWRSSSEQISPRLTPGGSLCFVGVIEGGGLLPERLMRFIEFPWRSTSLAGRVVLDRHRLSGCSADPQGLDAGDEDRRGRIVEGELVDSVSRCSTDGNLGSATPARSRGLRAADQAERRKVGTCGTHAVRDPTASWSLRAGLRRAPPNCPFSAVWRVRYRNLTRAPRGCFQRGRIGPPGYAGAW